MSKLWQVSVEVRAIYEVAASSRAEARKLAIEAAEGAKVPDDIEYTGDGVVDCVLLEE